MTLPMLVLLAFQVPQDAPASLVAYALDGGKLSMRTAKLRRRKDRLVPENWKQAAVASREPLRGHLTGAQPSHDRRWVLVTTTLKGSDRISYIVDAHARRVVASTPSLLFPLLFLKRAQKLIAGLRHDTGGTGWSIDLGTGRQEPIPIFAWALEDPDTGAVAFIRQKETGEYHPPEWRSPADGALAAPSAWARGAVSLMVRRANESQLSLSQAFLVRRERPQWVALFEAIADSVPGKLVMRSTSEIGGLHLYSAEGDGEFLARDRIDDEGNVWFIGSGTTVFGLGRLGLDGRYLYRWDADTGRVTACPIEGTERLRAWHLG